MAHYAHESPSECLPGAEITVLHNKACVDFVLLVSPSGLVVSLVSLGSDLLLLFVCFEK